MVRTIVSLDAGDKRWLEKKAAETGRSMTELVRIAVRRLRAEEASTFERLLRESAGTWKQGDGLKYQQQVRSEWR